MTAGMSLMTPTFGRNISDDGSTHTNSTGDDGAADAAASAVLDLSLIRRSPASPARDGAQSDGSRATGDTGNSDNNTDPGNQLESMPSGGLSPMDRSGMMERQTSCRRYGSSTGLSPRALTKRHGNSLRINNSRRCLSPVGRSPPKRQQSYRGRPVSQQPDGLPTDCMFPGAAGSPPGSGSPLSSGSPERVMTTTCDLAIQPLGPSAAEEAEADPAGGRQRRETIAAAKATT